MSEAPASRSRGPVAVQTPDLPPPEPDGSIGDRIERIVDGVPHKTAIDAQDGAVSYEDLNANANRLAHSLLSRGWGEPQRIGLLFDQGASAVAASFGVLKARHAFVPLDAADPPSRLQAITQDCRPALIITEAKHVALAASLAQRREDVLIASDGSPAAPSGNPGLSVAPDSLAYLFYTSGSTGQPKGVCQSHRNLLHYIRAYGACLAIEPADRLSLLYSLSFSASNMDVFGSLLHGATLCPYDIRRRGTAALADWLDKQSISILHAVPTVFRHLLQNLPGPRCFSSIRAVDLGGEAVYSSDVELFQKHFRTDCVLINHLAATEISVIAQFRIDPGLSRAGDVLPVGFPPDGVVIRVLRTDGTDAGPHEQGEMAVHSPFLSPGYWERPDLTHKAFAEDPDRTGWRIYRSGDLGHLDAERRLVFLGRKDHRVKIRGHSVDLGEVEAALRDTPWVRNLAVVAQEDPGEPHSNVIIAFLETVPDDRARVAELRDDLQKRLPPYMIPADFISVDSLPVTTSGKVDRRALAAMRRPSLTETSEPALVHGAGGGLEQSILALFQNILRRPTIRLSDDFFALGGDSLKATRLHQQLEDLVGRTIPLEALVRDATVTGIAAYIREARKETSQAAPIARPCLVPLRRTGNKPPLFLTHGAKGQAFVSPHFLNILGDDQPVYAYQASGLQHHRKSRNTIGEMAAQYIRAMCEVQPRNPFFLGSICVGSVVTLEMARRLVASGEAVGPLLLIDPPSIPPGERHWWKRWKRLVRTRWKQLLFQLAPNIKLHRDLSQKSEKGRIAFDANDPDALNQADRVARDFRLALLRYRLSPYAGPVLILASSERRSDEAEIAQTRQHYRLTGPVEFFRVEGKHEELHDVRNEQFERQLRRCMETAWAAFEKMR